MLRNIVILTLSSITLASCFSSKGNKAINGTYYNLDTAKKPYEVTVKVNEVCSLALESNITTGYDWHLKFDSAAVGYQVLAATFVSIPGTPKDIVGAPSTKIIPIKGIKAGSYKLKMDYERSWEGNSTVNSKEITIQVVE